MSPPIIPELFNTAIELQSAQAGAIIGLFVGLLYRDRPLIAYGLLSLGVLSAFGNASLAGLPQAAEIEAKPWYFLSGLYVSTVSNLIGARYLPAIVAFSAKPLGILTRSGRESNVVGSEEQY